MVVPSGSIAKTYFTTVVALTLEQEFGNVMTAKIGDLVEEAGSSWNSVSIENVLDMSTGHYRFTSHGVDDFTTSKVFNIAEIHSTKMLTAINSYRKRATPGDRWVYHTSDTYIAGVALRNIFQTLTGSDDLLSYMNLKVFGPLGLSKAAQHSIRVTYDDVKQPFSTTGMFFTIDDAIKIARFINPGNTKRGKIKNRQVLHAAYLDATIQLNEEDRGLEAYNDYLYNNGLYAKRFSMNNCEKFNFVPFTQGHGPNLVALFPNESSYIYFSDSIEADEDPDFDQVALEAVQIRC